MPPYVMALVEAGEASGQVAQALADAVLAWLDQPEAVARLEQRFTDLHLQLRQDMPARSTHAIEKILGA